MLMSTETDEPLFALNWGEAEVFCAGVPGTGDCVAATVGLEAGPTG